MLVGSVLRHLVDVDRLLAQGFDGAQQIDVPQEVKVGARKDILGFAWRPVACGRCQHETGELIQDAGYVFRVRGAYQGRGHELTPRFLHSIDYNRMLLNINHPYRVRLG